MIVRIVAMVALVIGLPMLAERAAASGPASAEVVVARAVAGAPGATSLDGLTFSTGVDGNARPNEPRVEFDDVDTVWASFEYRDHDPNARVTYLVRANGEDFNWGSLDCCGGNAGRYAFPIERRSGRELGGASYEVRIYVNDAEVAAGGFGVRGRQGFDDDNQNSSGGNDNN